MTEQSDIPKRKVYQYPALLNYGPKFMFGIICLFFCLMLWVLTKGFSAEILKGFFVLLWSALILLYLSAYWTDVETHEQGITLHAWGKNMEIPWTDVLKIGQVNNMNWVGLETWYVKVKKLSFAYQLLGLGMIGSFAPIFLIHKNLKNRKELIHEIQRRKLHHHDHSS